MATDTPIQHVIIIVKENHTFDNYFGAFPGAEGIALDHAPNPPSHDPRHDHVAWLNADNGAVRQQYTEADIPAYFAYARQFTLCDHYFTDVASQSEPNHLMLIAADSPVIDNSSAHRRSRPASKRPASPGATTAGSTTGTSRTSSTAPPTSRRATSTRISPPTPCRACRGCTRQSHTGRARGVA